MQAVLDSLTKNGINFQIYDNVRVEPTDQRYYFSPIFVQPALFYFASKFLQKRDLEIRT